MKDKKIKDALPDSGWSLDDLGQFSAPECSYGHTPPCSQRRSMVFKNATLSSKTSSSVWKGNLHLSSYCSGYNFSLPRVSSYVSSIFCNFGRQFAVIDFQGQPFYLTVLVSASVFACFTF